MMYLRRAMKRPLFYMRAFCGYAAIWTLVVCTLFFLLHYEGVRDTSWSSLYDGFMEHRSRRLQREVEDVDANLSVTYQSEAAVAPYYLKRPLGAVDTNDWHEFRDNIQKFEHLDSDDLITLKAKARSAEYCNPSSSTIIGEEGAAPAEFVLEQVQMVIRHGHRSPMYGLPGNKTKSSCVLHTDILPGNGVIKRFQSDMKKLRSTLPLQSEAYNLGLYPDNEICRGAQLTGEGTAQLLQLGQFLHARYIDKWHLLDNNLTSSQIYMRTTRFSRTFQSAIAFLYGFLPNFDYDIIDPDFTPNTNMASVYEHEISHCPILSSLSAALQTQRTKAMKNKTLNITLRREFSHALNTSVDKLPGNKGLLDGLSAYTCAYKQLPCFFGDAQSCVTWDMIGRLWQYMDINGVQQLRSYANDKKQRLTMYPLINEIAQRMNSYGMPDNRYKFILYSGHDVTVSPLVTALGVHDGKWPPFASRVAFELYTDTLSKQKYIRILYNGLDVTSRARFCQSRNLSRGLCPLSDFISFATVNNLRAFGASDYKSACERKKATTPEMHTQNSSSSDSLHTKQTSKGKSSSSR